MASFRTFLNNIRKHYVTIYRKELTRLNKAEQAISDRYCKTLNRLENYLLRKLVVD